MATAATLSYPSSERVEPGSTNLAPASFPSSVQGSIPSPEKIASEVVNAFNKGLESKNYDAVADLFAENGFWRDHLCLAWDPHTLKGRGRIQSLIQAGCRVTKISLDLSSEYRSPRIAPFNAAGDVQCLQFFIQVATEYGPGRGVARLIQHGDSWKIFTFFTSLEELEGYPEPTGHHREAGVDHVSKRGDKNWKELREESTDGDDYNPTVLIVGAGQGGLSLASRLKMLNLDALIIDKNDRIGDSWRNRYHQLVLHDPVWYDHMPYLKFPPQWPVFTPKDKIANFFESYVSILELNAWTKTTLKSSSWDETKKVWTVELDRIKPDGTKETRTLHPRHIVQATGHSGKMNMPNIEGMKEFKGDLLCHSSQFPGANPKSKGKRAIVVGSCNSGHDIAQDYHNKGYDVTMIQRSSTLVVSSKAITHIGLKGLYDENGPPTEDADLLLYSMPSELFKAHQIGICAMQVENDRETLLGLEKRGFKIDTGPSNGGFFIKYFQRGGGYYIDVGCSQLIIDGDIKVKHGVEIDRITPHGILFKDGEELPADEIVFATGYNNMRTEARAIFGDELAERVGDVWGFDEEGEMRGIWRRTAHPGFWFMGGNLAFCRYYSRILGLTIKAQEEGLIKQ